jgi:hypothetical protein
MRHGTKLRDDEQEPVRVLGRGLGAQRGVHLTLRALRDAVGRTQVEVSEASQMNQGDVSRLENRDAFEDCQVGTLQRYIAALGGQLELVATFGDKRIAIAAVAAVRPGEVGTKPVQRTGRKSRRR